MSLRKHRDGGKQYHKARMPAPSDAKLGTRVHQTERYQEDDEELEVDRCEGCRGYFQVVELDKDGYCEECSEHQEVDGME